MTLQTSRALGVLAAAAAFACTAHAQSKNDYNPSDYILLNGSAIKPDSKYPADHVGPGGGIKLGIPLTPSWDLQIGGNYGQSKRNGSMYQQWTGGVDALYLFTPGGFRPFILGGVGVARDHLNYADVGTYRRTAPYVQAGVGFQYKFTPRFGMQADVREMGTFYRHRIDSIDTKNTANTYADVGLVWTFGAPAPRPLTPIVATSTTTTTMTTPPPPPPPMVVPPPPPPPAPVMRKYTLSASELFAFDSAKLGANQPKLDEVASVMNSNADIPSVTIIGYTDRLGSKAYNQKLSVERANSVKAYLVGKGVASSRLEAVGKGESDPVAECTDVKKRPELIKCLEPNRRVEIQPVTYTKVIK